MFAVKQTKQNFDLVFAFSHCLIESVSILHHSCRVLAGASLRLVESRHQHRFSLNVRFDWVFYDSV